MYGKTFNAKDAEKKTPRARKDSILCVLGDYFASFVLNVLLLFLTLN
jgi:hypothetical protein